MHSIKVTAISVTCLSLMLVTSLEVARKYRISQSTTATKQAVQEGSEGRSKDGLHGTLEGSMQDRQTKPATGSVPKEFTTTETPGEFGSKVPLSVADIGASESSTRDTSTENNNVLETKVLEVEHFTGFELNFQDGETTALGTVEKGEATTLASVEEKPQRQPHIVFVLADDYGHSDIGYRGSWIRTPVLDRLAAEGVKLENYYVQPICTPTRSQLLSGRYQIRTGLQHSILYAGQPNGLPLDSPTLADKLKESGYSTHMVGKWHLGFFKREYMPHYRGFDTFYGKCCLTRGDLTPFMVSSVHTSLAIYVRYKETTFFCTFKVSNISIFSLVCPHQPLFLYLSYQAVHGPLQVPHSYRVPYRHIKDKTRRTYAGMVSAMDEGVGNLTDALKAAGLWDNTVFVFSSDNGGRVGKGASNYPLRGEKRSLWEGGVKSIGFVGGGRVKRRGAVSRELMHVSDWFPTLVTLAGGGLNGTKLLDGVDQWQAINEGKAGNRRVLLHNIDTLHKRRGVAQFNMTFDTSIRAALRVGDLKLITGDPDHGNWLPPPESDVKKTKDWDSKGTKNLWLFNITADPYERADLSFQRRADVMRMLAILKDFQESAVEPRFPNLDPRAFPTGGGAAWGPWL
ncbi:hypothetical protein EGW08_015275 [Elysia chlorotica]|uniref:Sulfatase N-terminal domain-containing protein n=1 Tax=Elysia chlorotica TaxID=188477 RepID=A0A433T5W7_ELYCH|nr:hypothetical protein EGW08_015275 [Elysia chlorotica]